VVQVKVVCPLTGDIVREMDVQAHLSAVLLELSLREPEPHVSGPEGFIALRHAAAALCPAGHEREDGGDPLHRYGRAGRLSGHPKKVRPTILPRSLRPPHFARGLGGGVAVGRRYLENLLSDPEDERFKAIRMGNKVFKEKVAPVLGAVTFLQALGFKEVERGWACPPLALLIPLPTLTWMACCGGSTPPA
jgi:hypothetical protein